MLAAVASGGDGPHVTRVLAEWVAATPLCPRPKQAAVATSQVPGPGWSLADPVLQVLDRLGDWGTL